MKKALMEKYREAYEVIKKNTPEWFYCGVCGARLKGNEGGPTGLCKKCASEILIAYAKGEVPSPWEKPEEAIRAFKKIK